MDDGYGQYRPSSAASNASHDTSHEEAEARIRRCPPRVPSYVIQGDTIDENVDPHTEGEHDTEDNPGDDNMDGNANELPQDDEFSVGDNHSEVSDVSDYENSEVASDDNDVSNFLAEQTENKRNTPVKKDRKKLNESCLEEILNREYDVEVEKNVLPPVSERLAKTMSKWLRLTPNREKIKQCFQETSGLMPENVEGLKQVRMNELLYQKLPFKAKVNDQRIRGINSYFTRGVGPLIAVLDNLLDFEASMKAFEKGTVQRNENNLKLKDSNLDITQIRKYVHQAIQILAIGNAICLQKRKSLLKTFLDNRYHYLIRPGNPVTDELLGPNLEQKITDSNKLMEAGKKIYSQRRGGFMPRNNVKKDRHHPYNPHTYKPNFPQRNFQNNYSQNRQTKWSQNNKQFDRFKRSSGRARARGNFNSNRRQFRGRYNRR